MTDLQKAKFFNKRLHYWCKRFRLDTKYRVDVARIVLEEAEADEDKSFPEYLKLEEMMVTMLERAFVGDEDYKRVMDIMSKSPAASLASCDDSSAEYWRFKVNIHPGLFLHDGDDFRVIADSSACHEALHMALWPLTSYARHLENK